MLFFVFVLLSVGVSGIDIVASGTIDLGLDIGTSSGLGFPTSQPDHWSLPASYTATSTTNSLDPSHVPSGALSTSALVTTKKTKMSTQTVTKTVSQIVLITVTAPHCTALTGTASTATSSLFTVFDLRPR